MLEHLQGTDQAGEGQRFYNVADFIADLWAGKLGGVAERLALSTPVKLHKGVVAVISGHSTADCNSYRVSWFDRYYWTTRHKWIERGAFEVIGNANKTATAA